MLFGGGKGQYVEGEVLLWIVGDDGGDCCVYCVEIIVVYIEGDVE